MKKFMLLITAVLICALPAFAESAGVLRLPDNLREIHAEAFRGDSSIGEVILPEDAVSIGELAFAYSSITRINLPASLNSIADNAFEGCGLFTAQAAPGSYAEDYCNLHGIFMELIPNADSDFAYVYRGTDEIGIVAYYGTRKTVVVPETINGYTVTAVSFEDSSDIETITLPDTVTSLSPRAFAGCTSLKRIVVPPKVTHIPVRAFDGCSSLESITIPESITMIGNYAFRGCESMKSFNLPKDLISIGKGTFSGCAALEKMDLPVKITAVPNEAFFECGSLQRVSFPDGLSAIGDKAFEKCENLESPVFPESLRTVGKDAFLECLRMEIIPLPGNITHIGEWAFFTQPGFGPAPAKIQCSLGSDTANTVFAANSENEDPTYGYEINDPASSDYFFIRHTDADGHHSLILTKYIGSTEEITPPDTIAGIPVSDIRYSCFEGCVSLKKVTLPAWLEEIPNSAFRYCTNLENVIIPDSVTTIFSGAFEGCTSLATCRIPESVIKIYERSFVEDYPFPSTTTLIVVENSAAHKYCIDNNQPFELAE